MSDDVEHFLLTRFNVRTDAAVARPDEKWLRSRMALFERYCLPSVVAQAGARPFTWIIFAASDSPVWMRERLQSLSMAVDEQRPTFEVVYHDHFDPQIAAAEVQRRVQGSEVLTTRLDNDDAISSDFMATVQRSNPGRPFAFINLVRGAQYVDGKAYLRPMYALNPFISLREKFDDRSDIRSVFMDSHNLLAAHGFVSNVPTDHPMWLQIIHGANLGNAQVGVRMRSAIIRTWFPIALTWNESRPGYVIDVVRSSCAVAFRRLAAPKKLISLARTRLGLAQRPAQP